MNIPEEADRRYPPDHEVEDPFGATGVARSDEYGYDECANRAFVAGAEWARKEALREAAQIVRDYWDACGELIDTNNGARLAFEAVAAQIADGDPS